MATIHFHSSDGRFCGSQQPLRQFTLDESKVTCRSCKGLPQDQFALSAIAAAYVAGIQVPA